MFRRSCVGNRSDHGQRGVQPADGDVLDNSCEGEQAFRCPRIDAVDVCGIFVIGQDGHAMRPVPRILQTDTESASRTKEANAAGGAGALARRMPPDE